MEKENKSGKDYAKKGSKEWSSWGQVAGTLLLGFVGFYFTIHNDKQQELNRNMQMATQLMADRESSETEFRRNMFQPMIEKIQIESQPIKKRIETFRLFQNNFHDLFNSRALYDILDEAIHVAKIKPEVKIQYLKELKNLARQTNQNEELLIGGNESEVILDSLEVNNEWIKAIIGEPKEKENDHSESHEFHIKIVEIDTNKNFVRVKFSIKPEFGKEMKINNDEPFKVDYYDSPLTDNILLPDKHRVTIVLEDIYPHDGEDSKNAVVRAKLKVIHFPAEFVTTGYRPSINKINELIKRKN